MASSPNTSATQGPQERFQTETCIVTLTAPFNVSTIANKLAWDAMWARILDPNECKIIIRNMNGNTQKISFEQNRRLWR